MCCMLAHVLHAAVHASRRSRRCAFHSLKAQTNSCQCTQHTQTLGWDFLDSMDPAREWDGWSFADIADPPKGSEGYPRLQIENRVYCSRVFRKLHIEVAARQDGLQVLHMVLYPRCAAWARGGGGFARGAGLDACCREWGVERSWCA